MVYRELLNQFGGWPLLQVAPNSLVIEPSILTQVLTTLLIGLLTALSFQLLLTCLGIAIGASVFQVPFSKLAHESLDPIEPHQLESQSNDLSRAGGLGGIWLGLGFLVTFNLVLFVASFLATKFSQINSPSEGAIAGIIIWSAYFLLLLWLSSTAVSSLLGLIISLTTAGFRQIISTIMAPFKTYDEPINSTQLVETVREELQTILSDIDFDDILEAKIQQQLVATPFQVPQLNSTRSTSTATTIVPIPQPAVTEFWNAIAQYISQADSKKLASKKLERKLQKLLQDLQADLTEDTILPTFNPVLLEPGLAQRHDLSDKRKQRIAALIETNWNTFAQSNSSIDGKINTLEANLPVDVVEDGTSTPLNQTAQISKAVLEAVSEQVFNQLPAIAQRLEASFPEWKALAPLVLPIARAKVTDFVESMSESSLNSMSIKEAVQETVERPIEQAVETSQAGIALINRAVGEQLEGLRDRASEQMKALQKVTETQTILLKEQAQQRLESARKAAAVALWWLFITTFTGAISAAFAGAIASGFNPLSL